MRKSFTVFSIIFAFIVCGFSIAQDNASETEVSGGTAIFTPMIPGGWVYNSPEAVLFESGPYFNVPGGGPVAGSDLSLLENSTLGMSGLGANHSLSSGIRVADDFTIPVGQSWNITTASFYAYQTGSTTTSTIDHINVRIWDGIPGEVGSNIVFGDSTTNVLSTTEFSNAYRHSETSPGTTRPIMKSTATIGTTLSEGTYWIDWQSGGTLASGPWAPPIAILGQDSTGNAKNSVAGVWADLTDNGSLTPYGFPFILDGTISGELEMSLTHTPGDLHVGIYNTGAIGTEQFNATGPGITWKGEQGLYMGGVVFGTAASASVNGVFGSFTSGGLPVLNDLKNVSSNFTAGFTSDVNFDQIAQAVLYDSAAPVPYDVEIIQKSYSNTGDDFVFIRYGFINRSSTELIDGYAGIALDWDIGNYATNSGGYGLYNTFVYQFDAGPTSSYYFGIVALDGAGGMRTSAASAFGPPFNDVRLNIFDWISTFDPTIPANGDFRSYIGSGPGTGTPVGDTSWVTFAIVAGDDLDQITNNAVDASVKAFNLGWTSIVVPVELSAFSANVDNRNVNLNWSTATELNNSGFQIERSSGSEYQVVGFVAGHGTTTDIQNYSYSDQNVNTGTYSYRLKQIDFDGTFEYSNAVEVEVVGVREFTLGQNYPNPFNPTTTINFSLAEPSFVKLAIYNLLGEEVEVLKNETMNAGSFQVSIDASSLPSGMYLYKIETTQFTSVRKMMLMK